MSPGKKEEVTLKEIYENINALRQEIKNEYVTKVEFLPVKTIVFSMVGVILFAVLTTFLNKNILAKDLTQFIILKK